MKQNIFFRVIVAIAMMLIGWLPSLAHDFEVDGVFYKKTSDNAVAVTYKGDSYDSYSNEYAGVVVIPSSVNYNGTTYSVTSIRDYAFRYCYSLTSIVIGNSVTSIGGSAFDGCDSLTKITCPVAYPPAIVSTTFSNYSAELYVPSGWIEAYKAAKNWNKFTNIIEFEPELEEGALLKYEGLIYYVTVKDQELSVVGSENSGNIIIPSSVIYNGNTYSVTSIGDYAFYNCSSLTSIQIPNRVTSIGVSAFSNCESLTSIVIGNSVTSIGEWAFNGCDSLTSIVVDTGNTKYDSRNGCNAIIETASNTLIAGCQNTIIPNSVTSIGGSAFFWCDSLTSVVIGNSVTSIGDNAFSGCDSMTSVVIGNCVTSIGWRAFKDCSSLSEITCWATTPPTIEPDTFSNYSAELYVPTGCKSAYRRTAYWRKFNISDTLDAPVTLNGNDVIVATIGENIVVKNAKLGSNVRVYATDGSIITSEIATDGDVVVKAPVKGIYIVAVDSKTFKVMVK